MARRLISIGSSTRLPALLLKTDTVRTDTFTGLRKRREYLAIDDGRIRY